MVITRTDGQYKYNMTFASNSIRIVIIVKSTRSEQEIKNLPISKFLKTKKTKKTAFKISSVKINFSKVYQETSNLQQFPASCLLFFFLKPDLVIL